MADLIARALGREIMAQQLRTGEPGIRAVLDARFNPDKPMITGYEPDPADGVLQAMIESEIGKIMCDKEERVYDGIATVLNLCYPEQTYDAASVREGIGKLMRSDEQLRHIRRKLRKYRWRDAAVPPHDSRRVVIWTNRGEYIAHYDHKWKCWRTTRDGLKITHWREQCGPENWPAAE